MPATETVTVAVACAGDGLPLKDIVGVTVYPRPIVAPVPTHQGSVVLLNPTAVTIPVIGQLLQYQQQFVLEHLVPIPVSYRKQKSRFCMLYQL